MPDQMNDAMVNVVSACLKYTVGSSGFGTWSTCGGVFRIGNVSVAPFGSVACCSDGSLKARLWYPPLSFTSQNGNGRKRMTPCRGRRGTSVNRLSTARTTTAKRLNSVSSGNSRSVSFAVTHVYRNGSGNGIDVTLLFTGRNENR